RFVCRSILRALRPCEPRHASPPGLLRGADQLVPFPSCPSVQRGGRLVATCSACGPKCRPIFNMPPQGWSWSMAGAGGPRGQFSHTPLEGMAQQLLGVIAPRIFAAVHQSLVGRFCSLIPGSDVKLSTIVLAGSTVLSAVGASPPQHGIG